VVFIPSVEVSLREGSLLATTEVPPYRACHPPAPPRAPSLIGLIRQMDLSEFLAYPVSVCLASPGKHQGRREPGRTASAGRWLKRPSFRGSIAGQDDAVPASRREYDDETAAGLTGYAARPARSVLACRLPSSCRAKMIAHIVKTLTRLLVAGTGFRGRSSIHELSISSCGWLFWSEAERWCGKRCSGRGEESVPGLGKGVPRRRLPVVAGCNLIICELKTRRSLEQKSISARGTCGWPRRGRE
jgi:hypothetical protein